jgi:putative transcriptional regulator
MDNVIRGRRKQNGWSQQELAELVGVSRQTISSIEKGQYDPSLPLAFELAAVFESRIEELFSPSRMSPGTVDS